MEARNKSVEKWFSAIEEGTIKLPRFQRHEAWRYAQVEALFENILRKPELPIGALLVLEVGNEELFHSRPIVGAPDTDNKVTMHLLDGQQRMTALWRALNGDYEDQLFFAAIEPEEEEGEEVVAGSDFVNVERVRIWDRKGTMQPVWAHSAIWSYERNRIPLTCLRPGAAGEKELNAWIKEVRNKGYDDIDEWMPRIYDLRARVANYPIPFLSLPVETNRNTALEVFIKMNTSASPLKDFDIVVAQLEEASGESLHDKVEELLDEVPDARNFGKIEDIILSVSALICGKTPLKKSYLEKDFGKLLGENWASIKRGFIRGVEFLQNEGIYNEKVLPTDVAVYLACALWANVEEFGGDKEGNARAIIRKVVWRSCYSDRYGKTSATRSYSDYRALLTHLDTSQASKEDIALFNEDEYPLPTSEEIVRAGWPSRKDRLPRAILATCLHAGGVDFADGSKPTVNNLAKREYHHLFPVNVLDGDRGDNYVNRAVNCALISWKTNRTIAAKTPLDYIQARTEASHLGEEEIRYRLKSHLVPYEELISNDYDKFITKRAEWIESQMKLLCDGKTVDLGTLT